jgi:hypothetical protein
MAGAAKADLATADLGSDTVAYLSTRDGGCSREQAASYGQ